MCGRYTLRSADRIRIKLAGADQLELDDIVPRFNIAPGQMVLAILNLEQQTFARMLLWGLVPSWTKESKGFINARAETLAQKPSFYESFQRRRCLIPADGFYEWKRTGRARQAFFIQLKDEAPFVFAGIWDEWKKDGVLIASCAIVTTTANELLEPIHDHTRRRRARHNSQFVLAANKIIPFCYDRLLAAATDVGGFMDCPMYRAGGNFSNKTPPASADQSPMIFTNTRFFRPPSNSP